MKTLPTGALVVVADGEGARLFRNRGEQGAVALHQFDLVELMNLDDDGPAGRSMRPPSPSNSLRA